MNGLESAYAAYLEGLRRADQVLWYAFDAIKLRLAPSCFYEPDFLVMRAGGELEIHEVKGTTHDKTTGESKPWVEDDAAVKIKVAAEKFPFLFRMVWRERSGAWREHVYGPADAA